MVPYSQKYWRELNLAVDPKIAIARILVDLNLAVPYGIAIRICYSYSTGPGIYGSKPTRVRGRSPRIRAVYVAINPWQPCYNYYISHLIG